ncbi:hypothetical protein BH10PSE2_BH10PSE2_04170 [soil metagenome]
MRKTRVIGSIAGVGRDVWDPLFPGELEAFDYLWAVETSGLKGFVWRYVLVEDDGIVVAAAPMFVTTYPLETTLAKSGQRLVQGVRRVFPGLLNLKLASLGSPCTETLVVGFGPDLDPCEPAVLLGLILDAFEAEAVVAGAGLLGVKDAPLGQSDLWTAVACARGYRSISGLPVAALDIDFEDMETYLAALSAGTRKDMRRKLRNRSRIRVEWRRELDGVLDRVMALYRQTRDRAEMAFEDLTPAYFSNVAASMGDRAVYALYWEGETLLAANLLLLDDEVLIDKFFVMDGERGRALDLYFLSWFETVGECLRLGVKRYESGAAAYAVKLRLGSRLSPTTLYFRHRNRLLDRALGLAAPLFAAAPTLQAAA